MRTSCIFVCRSSFFPYADSFEMTGSDCRRIELCGESWLRHDLAVRLVGCVLYTGYPKKSPRNRIVAGTEHRRRLAFAHPNMPFCAAPCTCTYSAVGRLDRIKCCLLPKKWSGLNAKQCVWLQGGTLYYYSTAAIELQPTTGLAYCCF